MFNEIFRNAYEKSDEVIGLLNYKGDKMVSTQDIITVVRDNYCPDIDISFASFSKSGVKGKYGAMMKTDLYGNNNVPKRASIILNTDNDAAFQRFSLLHEIGHLVTTAWDSTSILKDSDKNKFVVSTHIDYSLTNISTDDCEKDSYLKNEQIANIFALRVLIPSESFYKKIKEYQDIQDVARFFGVTVDAIISRVMIGG